MKNLLKKIPLATATLETIDQGYTFAKFRADLIAGIIVALVALPLSMALSIAVGLPPQNGLYTAIVAGIVAALLGGSRPQVSGPTAAFVVIVAPIVAEFGMRGIVWCQILAGIMLLALGISRLGKVITYVPYPVTTGFTAGIAVVIGTIALNDFFGVHAPTAGHWPQKVSALAQHIAETNFYALGIGVLALGIMIGLPKLTSKIPSAIVGIAVATVAAWFMNQNGITIDTIGSRFSYTDLAGVTQHGVPPYPPVLHIPGFSADEVFALPTFAELSKWFVPALVIAALAGLESLLSATVADSMMGTRHDPNAELNGIGFANIFSGLFLGIPATGAIARTATNINAGAVSPFASIIHAVLLLIFMVSLAPLIAYIPMSALSALLLLTAYRMSHIKHFIHLLQTAPKADRSVMIVCFGFTVMIDMVAGVLSGVLLATVLFLKRMMDATEVELHHAHANQTEYALPHDTMLFRIDGPLFFGTASKAFEDSEFLTHKASHVIIDLTDVPMIDVTALNMLEDMVKEMITDGRRVTICASDSIAKRIHRRANADTLSKTNFTYTVPEALAA